MIGLPTATDPIPLHGTTRVIFSSGPHLKQMVYCGRCSTWVHETSNSGWNFKKTCRFRSVPEGREGQGSLVEEEESAAKQREDQQLLQSLEKAQSYTKRDYHIRV